MININDPQYKLNLQNRINNDRDKIIKMYLEDKIPITNIAKQLGYKRHYVWTFLKKNNIKIEPYYANKYKVNDNYFEKIDSHEKAYWLGFLYSDGYVLNDHTIGLALHPKDIDAIEKFKKSIESDVPIQQMKNNYHILEDRGGTGKNKSEFLYRLRFKNKKMYNDLVNHGMFQNKSLNLKFPNINKDFIYSFMRGYIDGDGCICIYKGSNTDKLTKFALVIISSKFFIQGMLDAFKDENIKFSVKKADRCEYTYRADAGNKLHIIEFLDKIYKHDDGWLHLNRKYNKYLMMKEHIINNPPNPKMITNTKHSINF